MLNRDCDKCVAINDDHERTRYERYLVSTPENIKAGNNARADAQRWVVLNPVFCQVEMNQATWGAPVKAGDMLVNGRKALVMGAFKINMSRARVRRDQVDYQLEKQRIKEKLKKKILLLGGDDAQ